MEFPLVIKICVIPGFNQTALQELGYKEAFSYFVGRDKYYNDNSTYGWAGHTKGPGRPITVEEVLAKVSGYQIEEIIRSVSVWDFEEHNLIYIPLEYLRVAMVNFPNNCRSLDLSKVSEVNGRRCNQLFIKIRELGDYTIGVHFKGKSLDTGRNIREHNLRSTWDDIIAKRRKSVPLGKSCQQLVNVDQYDPPLIFFHFLRGHWRPFRWQPCIKLHFALRDDSDSHRIPVWSKDRRNVSGHKFFIKSESH